MRAGLSQEESPWWRGLQQAFCIMGLFAFKRVLQIKKSNLHNFSRRMALAHLRMSSSSSSECVCKLPLLLTPIHEWYSVNFSCATSLLLAAAPPMSMPTITSLEVYSRRRRQMSLIITATPHTHTLCCDYILKPITCRSGRHRRLWQSCRFCSTLRADILGFFFIIIKSLNFI